MLLLHPECHSEKRHLAVRACLENEPVRARREHQQSLAWWPTIQKYLLRHSNIFGGPNECGWFFSLARRAKTFLPWAPWIFLIRDGRSKRRRAPAKHQRRRPSQSSAAQSPSSFERWGLIWTGSHSICQKDRVENVPVQMIWSHECQRTILAGWQPWCRLHSLRLYQPFAPCDRRQSRARDR